MEHLGPALLVLVLGLLCMAAWQHMTFLIPQFWLTLGVVLAYTFPRRKT